MPLITLIAKVGGGGLTCMSMCVSGPILMQFFVCLEAHVIETIISYNLRGCIIIFIFNLLMC